MIYVEVRLKPVAGLGCDHQQKIEVAKKDEERDQQAAMDHSVDSADYKVMVVAIFKAFCEMKSGTELTEFLQLVPDAESLAAQVAAYARLQGGSSAADDAVT